MVMVLTASSFDLQFCLNLWRSRAWHQMCGDKFTQKESEKPGKPRFGWILHKFVWLKQQHLTTVIYVAKWKLHTHDQTMFYVFRRAKARYKDHFKS